HRTAARLAPRNHRRRAAAGTLSAAQRRALLRRRDLPFDARGIARAVRCLAALPERAFFFAPFNVRCAAAGLRRAGVRRAGARREIGFLGLAAGISLSACCSRRQTSSTSPSALTARNSLR